MHSRTTFDPPGQSEICLLSESKHLSICYLHFLQREKRGYLGLAIEKIHTSTDFNRELDLTKPTLSNSIKQDFFPLFFTREIQATVPFRSRQKAQLYCTSQPLSPAAVRLLRSWIPIPASPCRLTPRDIRSPCNGSGCHLDSPLYPAWTAGNVAVALETNTAEQASPAHVVSSSGHAFHTFFTTEQHPLPRPNRLGASVDNSSPFAVTNFDAAAHGR